jgi:hypothetical protein
MRELPWAAPDLDYATETLVKLGATPEEAPAILSTLARRKVRRLAAYINNFTTDDLRRWRHELHTAHVADVAKAAAGPRQQRPRRNRVRLHWPATAEGAWRISTGGAS